MGIRPEGGEGVQPMGMIIKFYNIIILSANVDKGGETFIHKIWIKRRVFFNPSLTYKREVLNIIKEYLRGEYIFVLLQLLQTSPTLSNILVQLFKPLELFSCCHIYQLQCNAIFVQFLEKYLQIWSLRG